MSNFVYEGGRVNERKDAVGDGWGPLLDELNEELVKIDPDYVTVQVKEKFGQLRVYLRGSSPQQETAMYKITHKYEDRSARICEKCGKRGKMREDGWFRTLCDEHETEYQKKRRIW